MEEAEAPRYWCHMCSQRVNPIVEIESVKCPICQSGFVEEMASSAAPENNTSSLDLEFGGSDPDRALSLWAPILLGMMGNQGRRRRTELEFEEGSDAYENHHDGDGEMDLEAVVRRRRSSAAILQLLQGMRAGILAEPEADQVSDGDRERVILINPFNQTIIVQGQNPSNDSISRAPIGSLGDYFIGPGLDLLLQHLSENDPNRYGTPPAQKDAVEALPDVRVKETMQCSVCLDDCEVGDEVKEMPCKHKFHSKCILPWLELHSSCPICRHQLPCDESKQADSEGSRSHATSNSNGNEDAREGRGRQFAVPLPWPLSSLFSRQNEN